MSEYSEYEDRVPGVVVRGDDGSLYFIPDSELEPYRIDDDEDRDVVQSELDAAAEGGDAARVTVPSTIAFYSYGPPGGGETSGEDE